MILVPRQLRRVGLTGDVPYFGGRFTPEQAYAAAHPSTPVNPPTPAPAPAPAPAASSMAALEDLLEAGVISAEEYDEIRARLPR